MEYFFQYNTLAKQFTSELCREGANRGDKWCFVSIPAQNLEWQSLGSDGPSA